MERFLIPHIEVKVDIVVHHHWTPGHSLHHSYTGGAYPLWLMLDGHADVAYPDGVFSLAKGQAGLYPSQIPRNIETPDGAEWLSYVMRATLPNGSDWLAQCKLPFIWQPSSEEWTVLQALMTMAVDEWQHVQQETTAFETPYTILSGLGKALLGHVLRAMQFEQTVHAEPMLANAWLTDVLRTIQQSPSMTISELAEQSHYSLTQLRRLFHTHTGMSPHLFLQRYRMDRARHLLTMTDQTISVIANQLGYDNFSHFSRIFKSIYGVLPSEFRRNFQVRRN